MTAHSRTHLGDRVAALVDGELSDRERDRALAHVVSCADCRTELSAQRASKALLGQAVAPRPGSELLGALQALAAPGGPVPPPAPDRAPRGPIVPELPAPGRGPRGARTDSRRPGGRVGRASQRVARRPGVLATGALTVGSLVLAAAFVVGGSHPASTGPVAPPAAELSVEHSRTTNGVTVGDPGAGLMTTFESTLTTPTRR